MLRQTRQREAIRTAFQEAKRPLTPGELHEIASGLGHRIGLRTVYRNIREMVAEGRVLGVDYPGQPIRYEMVSDHGFRPHFICRKCQKVFVLEAELPPINYPEVPGFTIDGDEIILFGICPECQEEA